MVFTYIVRDYFMWHYVYAWKELFHVWLNFLWFIIHFFSIPELFRSLFAPWKRMTEERKAGFQFEDLAAFVVINLLSRLLGALLRSAMLLAGLFTLTITIVGGICVYFFWLFAPLIIIGCLMLGIGLLFSYITI